MRKALLTGSKGFIGKNLMEELLEKNFSIIEINEDIFQSENWNKEVLETLEDFEPHVIFHVGACSDTLETRVNYMMVLNFEFTKILTDWAKRNSSKMIYSSSAASYGTNGQHPSNLYGWSKYVAEQYVISNDGIGLRYFNVYGPKEEHKGPMASVAYQTFIKHKNGTECKLFPKKPTRDFVYVKDVVSANIYAFENFYSVNSNWYDVGSGESRSFEDVMNLLNIPYTYHDESMIPMGYQFYTCSDKNKFLKGWQPNYNLERGMEEYKNYLLLSMNNII